jgi:hypothetical protein
MACALVAVAPHVCAPCQHDHRPVAGILIIEGLEEVRGLLKALCRCCDIALIQGCISQAQERSAHTISIVYFTEQRQALLLQRNRASEVSL